MRKTTKLLRLFYDTIREEIVLKGKKLAICFLGKPGCGKGTQAKILDNAGVPTMSSSGLLAELDVEHPFKRMMCLGDLIPGKDMAQFVLSALADRSNPDIICLDGSPRTRSEIDEIYEGLEAAGYIVVVVHFDISDDLAKNRMIERNKSETRVDAGKEDQRLARYKEETLPVLQRCEELGIIVRTVPINDKSFPAHVALQIMGKLARAVYCPDPSSVL